MVHEHLYYPTGPGVYGNLTESFSRLYLAGGVTSMRTGGNMNGYGELAIKKSIDRGDKPGPWIDATAPYLEGKGSDKVGPAKFTSLYLAPGDQEPGRMVNKAGDPAVPPGERHKAVHDQEGEQGDRAGGKRRRRRSHGPADDRADGDRDREVERAELDQRAPLS